MTPPYASVGRRIAAYLLDGLISVALVLVLGVLPAVLTGEPAAGLVGYAALLLLGLVQWCLVGTRGFSLGQKALGIRVLDAATGEPIGMGRALLRYLVLSLCGSVVVVLVVLVALLARDPRRQGWHDKAVRSVVVDERAPASAPAAAAAARTTRSPEAPPSRPPVPPGPPPAPRSAPPAPPRPAPAPGTSSPGVVGPLRIDDLVEPAPGLVAPPPPAPGTTWVLTPSTGSALPLTGVVVAGRDPDASTVEGAQPWPVDDPERSVSKTHASFAVTAGSLWVEDLDSTHGVGIRRNGDEARIDPRRSARLLDGDVVVLGAFEIAVRSPHG